MPPAVLLSQVSVRFRLAAGGTYAAVEDASLAVAAGEFVAIVGPTGCGKSTLLNVAAGLITPSSGRIEVFGAALGGLNRQSGYLFQAEALFPWKTALDNVAIGLETAGMPRAQARERAQTWLARVGLSEFAARYPHMLSGGQRKRVGLVQVLIRDPKILLMDEPFGPLDAQARQIMGNLLRDLWNADRSGGGDRSVGPRGDHVGRARRAHHRRLEGQAAASARHRRGQDRAGIPGAAARDLGEAEGRGAQRLGRTRPPAPKATRC